MGWKADLHVHSKYSNKPTNWLLKKFGCSECFTEPKEIYRLAQERGMTAFTITDHNQIAGCYEILEYPNTFISCEVTTVFPEDQCKIHVLTYNISEEQFKEMMRIRGDIYEFRKYLNQENIYHSVAHALFSVNDKLTREHYEKLVLMFNTFEMNGCRSTNLNNSLNFLLDSLTPEIIDELANKYDIIPCDKAWEKSYTGGSDDHTGIKLATKYTEVDKARDVEDFLRKITLEGKGRVAGLDQSPVGLAYNLYSIGYQYYVNKFNIQRLASKDSTLKIIDRLLLNKEREEGLFSKIVSNFRDKQIKKDVEANTLTNSIKKILDKTILKVHPNILDNITLDNISYKWFQVANSTINEGVSHLMDYLLNTAKRGNVFDIFHTLGSVGSLYFLISPYFISYSIFERDKTFTNYLVNKYTKAGKRVKIAHFTDTYYDINGVAKTLQQTVQIARSLHKDLTIITCEDTGKPGYKNLFGEVVFEPIGQYTVPEYPELKFNYPPFLEMLEYCYNNDFTHIHCATPGPVGLTALAVAKILKKPLYGTYHTAFPQFLSYLTEDSTIEELTWRYMVWFYNQMDVVYAPSKAMKDELSEKGIDEDKIMLYPRGVDIELFKPLHREQNGKINLLYAGRISKEKNLHLLANAFNKLSKERDDIKLQIVGDGPYKEEMESLLKLSQVEFSGYKSREDLAKIYSDADLFVFPSTTDTFGNVILEAQACGTPVIVTNSGGPMENIVPDKTGIIIQGNDEDALYNGIKSMLNKEKLESMRHESIEYMKDRSFEDAFLKTWDIYSQVM